MGTQRDTNRATVMPTFLGLGVPKAGSTWLYELLAAHPEIWVPPQRREVHFLNRHVDRGLSWYRQFFPSSQEAEELGAIGEITPHYLYCGSEKIRFIAAKVPTVDRFIVILRNPVERAYSHYWFRRRIDGFECSFERFLEEHPQILTWGHYAEHLDRWFEVFDRDQFLILQFEEMFADVKRTRQTIARFLEVDPEAFPPDAGTKKVNERHVPRYKTLYAWAVRVGRWLRRLDAYWITSVAQFLGVKRWFGRSEEGREPMKEETRLRLRGLYAPDLRRLQKTAEIDVSGWWDLEAGAERSVNRVEH